MYNYPYNSYQYNQMSQQYIDRLNNTRNTQTYCNNELIRVTGIDGAKAYQTQPNSHRSRSDDIYDSYRNNLKRASMLQLKPEFSVIISGIAGTVDNIGANVLKVD